MFDICRWIDSSIYRRSALFFVVSTELDSESSALVELVANEIILHLVLDSGYIVVKELSYTNNKDDNNDLIILLPLIYVCCRR